MRTVLAAAFLWVGSTGCPAEPSSTSRESPVALASGSDAKAKAPPASRSATAMPEVVDVGPAPLEGAVASLDHLGRAIVDALNTKDRTALLTLSVSASEYKHRLFDALVEHPSAYQMGSDVLWDIHFSQSHGDLQNALTRYGGRNLAFDRIESKSSSARGGLVFHEQVTLTAKDADGNTYELAMLGPVLEHPASGGFKVLSFHDSD